MGNMKRITKEDLANNPIPRLASCLVLDTSHSMGKSMGGNSRPIDELNKGVTLYFDAINNNEKTKEMVEISIITFGNKEFSPIAIFNEEVLAVILLSAVKLTYTLPSLLTSLELSAFSLLFKL